MTNPQIAGAISAYKRAEKAAEKRRIEMYEAITDAVLSGEVRQMDAAKELGVTREQIRRICYSVIEWRAGRNPDLRIIREPKSKRAA
ncbi:MAG TPA: hypothetical protein VI172_03605 [Candidatus Dormibacteraeota bacterium]